MSNYSFLGRTSIEWSSGEFTLYQLYFIRVYLGPVKKPQNENLGRGDLKKKTLGSYFKYVQAEDCFKKISITLHDKATKTKLPVKSQEPKD